MSWGNRGQWTDWQRLSSSITQRTERQASKRGPGAISSKTRSKLERQFAQEMQLEGLGDFAREHRFHETRKWRFDFAWIAERVAVEINGGLYKNGRHSRGAGQEADYEKFNAAIDSGWIVFQFGPNQVRNGSASLQVALAVRSRRRLQAEQPRLTAQPGSATE